MIKILKIAGIALAAIIIIGIIGMLVDPDATKVTAENNSSGSDSTEAVYQPKTISGRSEEKKITDDMSTEQQLAVLDGNSYLDPSDIKLIRIKTLLNDLAEKYKEPRDTIAEYTSKTQGVLHDMGIQESCTNILENMHKVGRVENMPYKDAVTVYLMERKNQ